MRVYELVKSDLPDFSSDQRRIAGCRAAPWLDPERRVLLWRGGVSRIGAWESRPPLSPRSSSFLKQSLSWLGDDSEMTLPEGCADKVVD